MMLMVYLVLYKNIYVLMVLTGGRLMVRFRSFENALKGLKLLNYRAANSEKEAHNESDHKKRGEGL
jgi:hypothetical protein